VNSNEFKKKICSSIKACQLLTSNFTDHIALHVDNAGNLISLDYSTATILCDRSVLQKMNRNEQFQFKTTIHIKQAVEGAKIYLETIAPEKQATQQGEQTSFLRSYWWVFALLFVAMMVSGGGAAPQQPSQPGNAQPSIKPNSNRSKRN